MWSQQDRDRLADLNRQIEIVTANIRRLTEAEAARAAARGTIGPWTTTVTPEAAPDLNQMRMGVEAQRAQLDMFLQLANGSRTWQQSLGELANTQQMFGSTWMQGLQGLNFAEMDHATIVEQAQARIRQAYGDTAEAQRMLATVTQQLNLQYQQQQMQTAQKVGQALVDVFPKSKAAAIAQAIINTAVGVSQALTLPFPLNWIQAAAVFASGMAQVRAIRSTNVGGGGGSVPAPGGGAGGGSGGSVIDSSRDKMPTELVVKGIDPAAIFSGQQLIDLMGKISDAVRHGVVLEATTLR
jgi:hypothetical protein